MHNFIKPFVLPVARRRGWKRICEIGSREGESIDLLRALPKAQITIIDPCLDCDLQRKFADSSSADSSSIVMKKGLSLEVLPGLDEPFDSILIDGDHNWYTVYNELKLIFERGLLAAGGIIFLHDVDWPWARRDLYYQPKTIPASHRHQFGTGAIVRGERRLADGRGPFAGGSKALLEGGERNGVLTAVEDFLLEHKGKFRFARARVGSGLGILMPRRGIRDDLTFAALAIKGAAYSLLYRLAQVRNRSADGAATDGPNAPVPSGK